MPEQYEQINENSIKYKRDAKIIAIENAMKLFSIQSDSPLLVDMNSLPRNEPFDIEKLMRLMKETKLSPVLSKQMTPIDVILGNAKEIYSWLIKDITNG